MPEILGLGTAVLAGVGGAVHCAAMCGPLAGAVGGYVGGRQYAPVRAALMFNAARIAGYVGVGTALSGLTGWLVGGVPELVATVFRSLAAILLILLAAQIAWGGRGLGAERLGARLWSTLRPLFGRAITLPTGLRPVAIGLLWGFMPCGLVYTMFVTAASRADRLAGAAVMAAFGLGTLPAVVGVTIGGASLGRALSGRWPRQIAAVALAISGGWSLAAALQHPPGHDGLGSAHHHGSAAHAAHVAYRATNAYTSLRGTSAEHIRSDR